MGNFQSKVNPFRDQKKWALGIIDVQVDFLHGGSLAIVGSEFIVAPINKLKYLCEQRSITTFVSNDCHPEDHMSFATTHKRNEYEDIELNLLMENGDVITVKQTLWPQHCIEGTQGSLLHPDLIILPHDFIIKKGTKKNVESYSAFGDEYQGKYEKTKLKQWLKSNGITDIILVGLATDFCVYYTALDALRLKFNVHIINSCTRGVSKKTTEEAINDMVNKGVKFYESVDEFCYYFVNTMI
jgi:nicotinamidase/pyrazinamidase